MKTILSFLVFLFYSIVLTLLTIPLVAWTLLTREIPKAWRIYMRSDWTGVGKYRRAAKRGVKAAQALKDTLEVKEYLRIMKEGEAPKAQVGKPVDWNKVAVYNGDKIGRD